MSESRTDHIVVAVPTRDRPEMLARCLESVGRLQAPPDATVSLVVVANCELPSEAERTRAIAKDRAGTLPTQVLQEPRLGEPLARNCAIDAALEQGAAALVFVDDDQTVPPDWLATMVRVWREEDADVVETRVRWEFEGSGELREFFERARDLRDAPPREQRRKAAATNGVLLDRRVLDELGLRFDASFGLRTGTDTLFFRQALQRGARQVLTRETCAVEHCPPEKETRRWILRRAFRIGGNKHQFGQSWPVRLRFAARGAGLLVGAGVLGLALWPARVRSTRALSRAARGAGMLAGLFGYHVEEFRRTVGR